MKETMGVILILSGLVPIYVQIALQIGWITKKQPENNLEMVPAGAIKFLDKLLDTAGWMVVVGLILIYLGMKCLSIVVFGGS